MYARVLLRSLARPFHLPASPRLAATATATPCLLHPRRPRRHISTPAPTPPTDPAADAEALLRSIYSSSSSTPNPDALRTVLALIQTAVSRGSPRGKALLATLHRDGLAVSADPVLALNLFRESAEAGDVLAQASLGVLLLERHHAARDPASPVAGEDVVLEEDQQGNIHARVALRREDGSPIMGGPTPAEMVRNVRKARRKAGFQDAQAREYEEYRAREEESTREEERRDAIMWLEKAVGAGSCDAMVALGNEVLESEPRRALALYETAVREGRNTDAYFNLGQIYTSGVKGVDVDQKKAAINFAMAAQLGDASAQFYLGHLYRVGNEYVNADPASARQYIELAAEQRHPAAVYYLALMHKNGEGGLEASEGPFRRYVTAAAELGHGPAHGCLGDMYYKGTDGVGVDYQRALKHFTEAGKLGESDALCSAAAMHFRGLGTEEDHHEAFLLYQEAVQLGSIPALRNIGSMYFHGQGVPGNKKVAAHFFTMADESEAKRFEEGEEMLRNTPVTTAEAPKHPMADIPRAITDVADDELREQPATQK